MPATVPAGVYGRRIPAGGIPILAAIDPSAAVSRPSVRRCDSLRAEPKLAFHCSLL